MVKCPRGISQVKLVLRLLGAIWVSSLVIIAGFALVQIYAERDQILTDLERRAWLTGEVLKEAVEPADHQEVRESAPRYRDLRPVRRARGGDPRRGPPPPSFPSHDLQGPHDG